MKQSKRKSPARGVNHQEVGKAKAAGEHQIGDWHQQIKRRDKEWPARAERLPTGVAVAAANLVKQRNTPCGVCFFLQAVRVLVPFRRDTRAAG